MGFLRAAVPWLMTGNVLPADFGSGLWSRYRLPLLVRK